MSVDSHLFSIPFSSDFNECKSTEHNHCVANTHGGLCNNTAGSYYCACQTGFKGNGIVAGISFSGEEGTGCTGEQGSNCFGFDSCFRWPSCQRVFSQHQFSYFESVYQTLISTVPLLLCMFCGDQFQRQAEVHTHCVA